MVFKFKKGARLANSLRALDIFGREITLTFEGERKFKTMIGGIFSIIAIIIVIAVGGSGLSKVIQNSMISFAS